MAYPKYLRWLDAFGLIAVSSGLAYAFCGASMSLQSHLDGLWGNLSTEMVGIWLAVRLVDWVIRRHESYTKSRVRTVRFMRYAERLSQQIVDFRRPSDLKLLLMEMEWIETRMPVRRRNLSSDERNDLNAFFRSLHDFLALFPDKGALARWLPEDDVGPEERETMISRLETLESARRKAEKNILDETDEDDGL